MTARSFRAGPLTVRRGRKTILHGVTAGPFQPGTMTALLGPNGSGKSTLLRALAGLLPSDGPVWLGDTDLAGLSMKERARLCAFMPQSLPPPIHMQAIETVLVSLRTAGGGLTSGHDLPSEALDVFEQIGISGLALRCLDELSGGQRQLIGLAQVLVRHPALLMLDEPLSALDLRHQFTVMDLLRRETRRRNMVTLIVLHDLSTALRFADTALLLLDGKVLEQGPVREVITSASLRTAYGIRASVTETPDGDPVVLVSGSDS